MNDKPTHQDRLKGILHTNGRAASPPKKEADSDETELSCAAFGYLRGVPDHAGAIEFRLRDGSSAFFPYGWLGPWRYKPSEGLLLKFSGDIVYVVLIRGSNLDKPLKEGAINLTTGGLQRHRVVWIREMNEEDIQKVGESGPTIDSIQIEEFESQDALREWLKGHAPAFVRTEH
jgi:hypothetical protein